MSDRHGAERLRRFRERLYGCFRRRADALFEICDALLASGGGAVSSPVHLSLAPVHRRGWGSLYAALRRGSAEAEALRDLLARHPLAEEGVEDRPRVYAVDVSVWPRSDAEASPERGYYYHPSRHSAGQPIVAGWAYQFVAELGFGRGSWIAPVDARRVRPVENATSVAGEQVQGLLRRVPKRPAVPLFVFDAGYDAARLSRELAGYHAQILVRLNSRRCFYADPPEALPGSPGRPRRHGRKFVCKDPATRPEPTAEHLCRDADYGEVRVRAWSGLHPKLQTRPSGEIFDEPPIVRGTVVLVEVGRLPRETREPRALWLWWAGPDKPDLALLWRAYCRRFDLEHAFRFLKERLGWTSPRVRHPEQADLWTWLIVTAYSQLRLARCVVADRRLPWEPRYPARRLTPVRVLRGFSSLLPGLGTPAEPPKPCGRSPGRPKGSRSGRAKRYPAVKKKAA